MLYSPRAGLILARYDAIRDQSKRAHLYNHLSNYTKNGLKTVHSRDQRTNLWKNRFDLLLQYGLLFIVSLLQYGGRDVSEHTIIRIYISLLICFVFSSYCIMTFIHYNGVNWKRNFKSEHFDCVQRYYED